MRLDRFLYTGQEWVQETGLYNFDARPMDPTTRRCINQDPARQGSNWYALGGGDPVNNIDPTGLAFILNNGKNAGLAGSSPANRRSADAYDRLS